MVGSGLGEAVRIASLMLLLGEEKKYTSARVHKGLLQLCLVVMRMRMMTLMNGLNFFWGRGDLIDEMVKGEESSRDKANIKYQISNIKRD